MAARAVPAFYLHFIYCGMQFAVVANELNMRIAIIPKENEKSEPFSNRKQVRIFLVWWARVDYASRAAKNSLAGCFCPAGRKAPGRSCSHPPAYVSLTFAQKKTASVSLHQRFFHGRGWITQAAHLKRPRRGLFAAGTYSGGPYELRLPIFLQPLGGALKNRSAVPASPPCFRRRRRSAPLLFESTLAALYKLPDKTETPVSLQHWSSWWARVDSNNLHSRTPILAN